MKTIILLAVINSFFIFITGNTLESDVNDDYNATCLLNEKHWILIKWYFERCTYIEITEIALNQSYKSKFSNQIIKGLMSGNKKRVTFTLSTQFRFLIRNSDISSNLYR